MEQARIDKPMTIIPCKQAPKVKPIKPIIKPQVANTLTRINKILIKVFMISPYNGVCAAMSL